MGRMEKKAEPENLSQIGEKEKREIRGRKTGKKKKNREEKGKEKGEEKKNRKKKKSGKPKRLRRTEPE